MSKNSTRVLKDGHGPALVGLVNWMAGSLDVSKISKAEAVTLFVILIRTIAAICRAFPSEMSTLMIQHFADIGYEMAEKGEFPYDDEEGESDDDETNGPNDRNDVDDGGGTQLE